MTLIAIFASLKIKEIAILELREISAEKWQFHLITQRLFLSKMKNKLNLLKQTIVLAVVFVSYAFYGQEIPTIKYLDQETVDEVKIDFDNDGDMDIIVAGVFPKKNQGRVYLIENIGSKYDKPKYIYSFPTIGLKQQIEIFKDGNLTTIITEGTDPNGKKDKFIGTLYKGNFEGLILPPVTSETND